MNPFSARKTSTALPYQKFHQLLKRPPRIDISIQRGPFRVQTVCNRRDRMQAMRLRYDVFHREFMGRSFPIGIDQDIYDVGADLLVVIDERIRKVVGTYRLICSRFSDEFYTKSEFGLESFLQSPGIKLELSRACVARSHRNSTAMALLWKGLGEYMKAVEARYLFGCSSVQTIETAVICGVHQYLCESGHHTNEHEIRPIPAYEVSNFGQLRDRQGTLTPQSEFGSYIPPLLGAYLKTGAKVYGEPALDRKFQCTDFFTVLDVEKMAPAYRKRFLNR